MDKASVKYRHSSKTSSAALEKKNKVITDLQPQPKKPFTRRITLLPRAPRTRKQVPTIPAFDLEHKAVLSGQRLHETVTLLQQLHVRNKNQHRGQTWFKQLGFLRRALSSLLEVYVQLDHSQVSSGVATGAEDVRTRFKKESELRREKERLEDWIREVLLGMCYVRFTALVADSQFAQVGVVLVGVLADVGAVVGVPRRAVEQRSKDGVLGRGLLEVVGRRVVVTGRGKGEVKEESYALDSSAGREEEMEGGERGIDQGEVIERRQNVGQDSVGDDGPPRDNELSQDLRAICGPDGVQDAVGQETSKEEGAKALDRKALPLEQKPLPDPVKQPTAEDKVKKKSRKRKNAIDDIFAGF